MDLERPDMSGLAPEVVAYIERLEATIQRRGANENPSAARAEPVAEPSEPPTTLNVITVNASGIIKRTPRHFYERQRRSGMGIFDLETPEEDPPAFLAVADEGQGLVLITDYARAFPLKVSQLAETPVRARGQALSQWIPLRADERIAQVVVVQESGYLTLVTTRGQVRRLRYNYLGRTLQPGTLLYDPREGGPPAASAWTRGDGDLFIATRNGIGIRFSEIQVPVRGCLGMRVDPDDAVVGVAGVTEDSGVLLIGNDGKGAIRLMSGFSANKSPGSGGKTAFKTDCLIGAMTVADNDDVFIISRLSKIIRFRAAEIPPKAGVVQGVNCMALRADHVTAMAVSASHLQGEE